MANAGCVNAGTIKFLYQDGDYYFIEVDARIQVENTISETVAGIEIMKWQLRIAGGEKLDFAQSEVQPRGATIGFRINTEDPAEEFDPLLGTVETYRSPRGIGVRVDDGIDEGDPVAPFYDSIFGKFVVAGQSREEALMRSKRAFAETTIKSLDDDWFYRQVFDDTFRAAEHSTT